jgi:hypothetical protein
MSLKGDDMASFHYLNKSLRAAPISVSHAVANRAAPAVTSLAQGAFDGGQTVYGTARPRSESGGRLTLNKTGATRRALAFVSTGRIMRAILGTKYGKYLVGKYEILPNGPIPLQWRERISEIVHEVKVDL